MLRTALRMVLAKPLPQRGPLFGIQHAVTVGVELLQMLLAALFALLPMLLDELTGRLLFAFIETAVAVRVKSLEEPVVRTGRPLPHMVGERLALLGRQDAQELAEPQARGLSPLFVQLRLPGNDRSHPLQVRLVPAQLLEQFLLGESQRVSVDLQVFLQAGSELLEDRPLPVVQVQLFRYATSNLVRFTCEFTLRSGLQIPKPEEDVEQERDGQNQPEEVADHDDLSANASAKNSSSESLPSLDSTPKDISETRSGAASC